MYKYKITFLGGNTMMVRANSPKEAVQIYTEKYQLEVIQVKWVRGL